MIPRQQMIDAAKAPVLTFNEKNWEAVKASISPDFVYEKSPPIARCRESTRY